MSRWERLAPLSGVGFVLFMLAGMFTFNFYEYLPDPATIQAHLADNSTTVQIAAAFGMVAAFLIAWFAGSARSAIRGAEGGNGRLSAVAFGGGMVAAAMLASGFAAMGASAAQAGSASGISGDLAAFSYNLYGTLYSAGAGVGFALLIGAFSVVAVRARMFGAWFGWVGGIITVASLNPEAWIALPAIWIWVIAMSIWMYRRGSGMRSPMPPAMG